MMMGFLSLSDRSLGIDFFFQRKKWKMKDFMSVEMRIISPEKEETLLKFRAILYSTQKRMNRSSLLRYF
jgi:hypothetical protein